MSERDAGDDSRTIPRGDGELPATEFVFVAEVIDGPDRGATFTIDSSWPSPVLVGKSPACAVRLADPEVSRRHATLELAGHRMKLTDLDSTNGTSVDGLAIGAAYLAGGEAVRLGRTAMRFTRHGALRPPVAAASSFGRVIGESVAMKRIYPICHRLAVSNVPVIVEGETGTGKEVLAEALHEQGPRAELPFVVFDCTTVAPNLVESELFGHEKGAFTGAAAARRGVFEQASGGTLLIDEIGDLDPLLQPKLLRALERGEVRRVGADRWISVDVRVIAATRRDLDQEVQQGRFRDDLFHRLAVGRIELPPLRRRDGDIDLLTGHFARELGADLRAIDAGVLERWRSWSWPGNVRELRNAVARYIALGELADDGRTRRSVPPSADFIDAVVVQRLPIIPARQRVVDEFERRYIEALLADHGGNAVRAAAASGIARRHFDRLRTRGAKKV
jgi:DNA-binding NtrC family response regulator